MELKADHWKDVKNLVLMTATGENKALFILGDGGLGKTETVLRTLEEAKHEYVHLRTFSTPMELYSFLFVHKDKLIVFDDIEGVLDNKKSVSILKSCLWGYNDVRTVQYLSSTDKLTVPPEFVFNGRTIFLLNEFPKNKFVRSLVTRSVYHELSFPYEQKMVMMEDIAKHEYPGVGLEDRLKIFKFIKDYSTPATKELNFRTLIKAFNIFKYSKDGWQPLVKLMLQPDTELASLRTIEETYKMLPVNGIARLWMQETGQSRSSFFRLRKKLKGLS